MLFYYKAKKLSGEEIEGTKEAADEFDLAKILKQEGFFLTHFTQKGKRKNYSLFLDYFSNIFGRVKVFDKIIFCRNLSVMITAGISLNRGLETLARQTANKKFKTVLKNIADDIKKGESLEKGLKKYPAVFPPVFSAIVKAGEKTGKLDESLKILGSQLERSYELTRTVKGALIYPVIVIIVMIIIGILMMIYVVPTLIANFSELKIELPLSTRILIAISNFLVNHTLMSFVSVIGIAALLFYLYSKPKTKNLIDFIFFRAPIISALVLKVNSARTARTLGSLVGSGVEIVEALEITSEALENHYYKDAVKEAKEKVQTGEQISKIFSQFSNLYPAVFIEMIMVGEETGNMSDMLLKVAGFFEDEVAQTTKNLSTVIEPILMVFIGIVVGFFVISILTPMYSMLEGF